MTKKKINFFFRLINNTVIIFIYFLIVLTIDNIIFYNIYLVKRPDLISLNGTFLLSKISNGFGEIIDRLLKGETPYLLWTGEIKLYTARNLLLPYYLILLDKIALNNFLAILLIKNISFGIILFSIIKNFNKNYNNLFLIFALFLIYYLPFNNQISFGIENEEGLLNYLIIILFLILISEFKKKSIFLSLALSSIFFLKGSMFFLTFFISIIYFFIEKKDKLRYLPFLIVTISNIIWGAYTYNVAGYFAFGTKGSSMSASNLYMISTKKFNISYPDVVPDVYLYRVKEKIIKDDIKNDKEFTNNLIKSSIKFIKDDPINFLYGVTKRIYVLMFNPFKDAQWPNNYKLFEGNFDPNIHQSKNPIRISNIINKLIFNISLLVVFYQLFIPTNKKNSKKIDYYYISILILYLFPYIVAWIYDRHSSGIYIISHLYLFLKFLEKKNYFLFRS